MNVSLSAAASSAACTSRSASACRLRSTRSAVSCLQCSSGASSSRVISHSRAGGTPLATPAPTAGFPRIAFNNARVFCAYAFPANFSITADSTAAAAAKTRRASVRSTPDALAMASSSFSRAFDPLVLGDARG